MKSLHVRALILNRLAVAMQQTATLGCALHTTYSILIRIGVCAFAAIAFTDDRRAFIKLYAKNGMHNRAPHHPHGVNEKEELHAPWTHTGARALAERDRMNRAKKTGDSLLFSEPEPVPLMVM